MTPSRSFVLAAMWLCPLIVPAADGPPVFADDFNAAAIGESWVTEGPVSIDDAVAHGNGGRSLRIGPQGKAVLKLRDTDGSGRLSLWIHDDLSAPANPKDRHGGPQWGLADGTGRILVAGCIYAPYLQGDRTFSTAEYSPPKESPWFNVQYLGEPRREGWHRWTFDMDPDAGLTLAIDDKPVRRFDWNRSGFAGFSGVVLLGDGSAEGGRTLWVDDVEVVAGPPMRARPTPPPPPPPVVPDTDPEPTGPAVALTPAVRGKHPRLLFGPEDLPRLRDKALSPAMKQDWDDVLAYLPACVAPTGRAFLRDATDGQRQGLWRMPTLALHYLVTGEKRSLDRAVEFMDILLKLDHWETGEETDAGMSSANIMIGAAICYDWLYRDLDPDFREEFRRKLVRMARAQYHGGHLNKLKSTGYWQGDPANNHRWHRDAGLALAVLTACEPATEEQWLLNRTAEELAFVAKWLPADGTSHESPTYLTFGMVHLSLALQAADRCLGTDYLDGAFARNVARFKTQTITPGFANGFQFGDSAGVGGYNHFLWQYTGRHGQGDLQAGLERLRANDPEAFQFGWMGILWKDPAVTGNPDEIETTAFFPDLGLAILRDSWEKDGVAVMLKCGPFGGYTLNRYRNENDYKYVNVAHDDPDANSFMLFAGGGFLAESDRYSKHKQSANHNTLLVNGKGQTVRGRREGGGWTQPATGKTDMTTMAVVTGWKDAGETVIFEGEAGGSYDDLDRFRRTFVWVRGRYLLVLDDIRAPRDVDLTWLLQAPELVRESPEGAAENPGIEVGEVGRYRLRQAGCAVPVAVTADAALADAIVESPADHRGEPLGWRQLRLQRQGRSLRVVSLYDPWQRTDLDLAPTWTTPGAATVRITGKGLDDTWEWQTADGEFTPSSLKGRAVLGAADAPATP